MNDYMLDTNAFNNALDAGVSPAVLSQHGKLYITHIQLNEIQATRNQARLADLLAVFESLEQERVPTAAAVWDVSEFGGAEFGSGEGLYEKMLAELNRRNKNHHNNAQDILIALTAFKRGYVLVTNDRHLGDVLREFGGRAVSYEEFVQ